MSIHAISDPNPAKAAALLIPVFASKSYRAWPKHDDGGHASYVPPANAFQRHFPSDAHFAAYSVPETARRLSTGAAGKIDVQMRLIVFDVDGAAHSGSDEWWRSERAKLFDLLEEHPDGFIYRTRGGYRIVYQPSRPIAIQDDSDRYGWWALYLAWVNYLRRRFDIVADPSCKDWTRLFRLPRVTRDGAEEDRETIGDANDVGAWDCALAAADMADPDKASKKTVAPAGKYTGAYRGRGRLVDAFDKRGWLGHEIEPGKLAARCPWESSHSMGRTYDTSTVIYLADESRGELGFFYCSHGHCQDRGINEVIAQFTDNEMGKLPICGATTSKGKTCAATELLTDGRCQYHTSTKAPPTQQPADASPHSDWSPPLPLPGGLLPVPAFDENLLPEALRPWLVDIAERSQCPIEYAAVGAVVALSSVIGRRCGIRPKRQDDWLVIPNLWGAAVGPPGVMKSPALKEAMRPLERLAAQSAEQHQRDVAQFERNAFIAKATREVLEKSIKDAIKEAIKKGADPSGVVAKFDAGADERVPTERRYVVNDTTVEKLGELLNQNPNGVLHFRDELTGFLRTLDRDGHEGDRAFYLQAWNGDAGFTYDRISRGTLRIEAACVSMLGGIQPGPLADYLVAAMRGGAGDDGLVQRFQLLVYPDVSSSWVNVDRWPDGNAKNRAFTVFERLADGGAVGGATDADADGTRYLRFSPEAQELADTWRADLEQRLRNNEDAPVLVGHLAKYRKLMPALSLIFHLADAAWDDKPAGPVSADAAELATRWCTLLEAHARRIYQAVTERSKTTARLLANRLQAGALSPGFTVREVCRHDWSGLTDREDVERALELLEDLNWLRGYAVATGGRPKVQYEINPAVAVPARRAA
jgi:hypothetical protein